MPAQPTTARKRKLQRRSGFTLIELMVVVVIIGILASVAVPGYGAAMDKARGAAVASSVKAFQTALETYGADNNGSYPNGVIPGGANAGAIYNASGLAAGPGAFTPYMPANQIHSPWAPAGICQNLIGGADKSANVAGEGSGATMGGKPPSSELTSAAYLEKGVPMTPLGTDVHSGRVPAASNATDSGIQCYGNVIYGYDASSSIYVIYGLGKDRNNTSVVAAVTNGGR